MSDGRFWSKAWLLTAAFLFALVGSVISWGSHHSARQPSLTAAPARPMPTFDLETLESKRFSSSSLLGKVALVDFWATWCKPCIEEIPALNGLQARYAAKGFIVVGITVQSGWARDIKPDAGKLNIRYPIVVGNDKVEKDFGGIWGLPATFLINRKGQIYKKYIGQYPLAELEADIQALLAEKP